MERKEGLEREEAPVVREQAAPTAASITVFAVVMALLFGGMYFFFPENFQSTAITKSPTVAEHPAPGPTLPVTTGQGGNTK